MAIRSPLHHLSLRGAKRRGNPRQGSLAKHDLDGGVIPQAAGGIYKERPAGAGLSAFSPFQVYHRERSRPQTWETTKQLLTNSLLLV